MTSSMEKDKAAKLKRLVGLRIMNAIGMIAWHQDSYGGATQMLRLVHPVSWVWISALVLYSVVIQGVPDTVRDLKYIFSKETVWW